MILLLPFLLSALAAPQGYNLHPGDVVIGDTAANFWGAPGTVRILHPDGSRLDLPVPTSTGMPAGVYVDRDGSILVSLYRSQDAPDNGAWRIDRVSGIWEKLNSAPGTPIEDNFGLCRDADGYVVIADGFAGLARIDDGGGVDWFSPPSQGFDPSIGIALDYDGDFLVSEAPNYSFGGIPPGRIFAVDGAGARRLLVSDSLLSAPNGLALEADGSILVTDALDLASAGGPVRHGVVRVHRNGTMQRIAWAGLAYPKGVAVLGDGLYLVADANREALLLGLPGGTMHPLLQDSGNGLPVDRPVAVTVIPPVLLELPDVASIGSTQRVRIEVAPRLAGSEAILAVSRNRVPTSLAAWWPGSVQTTPVDLAHARLIRGRTNSAGHLTLFLTIPNDPALIGHALQTQAILPSARRLSTPYALPIR